MRRVAPCLVLAAQAGLVACTMSATEPEAELHSGGADLSVVGGARLLGPGGGRLSVGPVTVEFPPGALAETVRITLTPVRPGAQVEPGDLTVPLEPPSIAPVRIGPESLLLHRPLKVSIATQQDMQEMTVARVGRLLPQTTAWLPLPGQGRSPSLLWAQTTHLGVFALVPATCCRDGATCSVRCDVGPLRYRCMGSSGQPGCCDPFARPPQWGEPPLCTPASH
ncbi:MAG: hypothetical protein RMK29_09685 [Myxococcales bacterium]|nr:hypothetical protein [Myxococcota bacterium]MDW8281972.1 hypothetical protein [Myxococcales bacterium]